jgi:uncharacterized protein YjbI with pentapeptide repeats
MDEMTVPETTIPGTVETSAEPEVTDTDLLGSQTGLGRRRGLRKLKPNLIDKATDDTAKQVGRSLSVFIGTAAFCLLSLLSPDSALLGGNQKLNVPFAGPVSFFGFMLLGPAVLIMLRIYLQIYVEHGERLDRLARCMPVTRAPTLVARKNSLIRGATGLTFYLLLPATMLRFAWKAAVFPFWGSGLLCVAVGVIAAHAMLPLRRISWRARAVLSLIAAFLAAALLLDFGPVRRPFDLSRANLSGQWLFNDDLAGADLTEANLTGAHLFEANLTGAHLFEANLTGADLTNADLRKANLTNADLRGANLFEAWFGTVPELVSEGAGANLTGANLRSANLRKANLTGANLTGAHLSGAGWPGANLADLSGAHLNGADLSGADLSKVTNLTQQQLDKACGKPAALPLNLSLDKPCLLTRW